jgi:hypothetical protein
MSLEQEVIYPEMKPNAELIQQGDHAIHEDNTKRESIGHIAEES